MRHGSTWLFLLALIIAPLALATEGTFQGRLVDPPPGKEQLAAQGWVFVEGRNRMVRRVDVSHAVIVFATGTPSGQKKCGSDCLAVGQEVRVTAEQDSSGEWRAKRVEILSPGGSSKRVAELTARLAGPSTTFTRKGQNRLVFTKLNYPHDHPNRGSWITMTRRLCIQPFTEKSIIPKMVRRYNERCPVAEKDRFSQECAL